ncbi:hypothetical protein WA026_020048 [Henosepilachna vigintioctopunctata]|uniref:DDE Tnp4 domain-containing protein n=1 Tax=Henosepilachna vigintioctopunctata TaxID=420089 RepID=A0AAW1UVF4_9CUCU
MWIHEINSKMLTFGEFHHLFPDLLSDEKKFFKYFRMSPNKFSELLALIRPDKEKRNTTFRPAISSEERLGTCLRFLATGDSFVTISFSYRQGEKSVRRIVYDTCDAIWKRLSPIYMAPPKEENWQMIEQEFSSRWNFPNCVGAIDGKHIVINKPFHSGSLYYNYIGFCSTVLMAVVDANFKFAMIDVGGYGKNSDGSIFSTCNFGKRFREGTLQIPNDKILPGTHETMPYVLVGDEAFPLQRNLMRPYPGVELSNNEEKKIFNYRLSRARNPSEDAFGILMKIFRLYQRRLELKHTNVNKVVLATCCLHNFLKWNQPHLLAEVIEIEKCDTRQENGALQNLRNIGGAFGGSAYAVREKFKDYFCSPNGSVEWQSGVICKGKQNTDASQLQDNG